jgi:ethanolamine utilization microcompartment shell protein EutL
VAPGFLFSLVVVGAVALAACTSSPTPSATLTTAARSASTGSSRTSTTSTSTAGATFGQGEAAVIAACQSDWNSVEVALQAYDAEMGSYPTPPSSWSAATYAANYTPLTASGHGGPFMASAPLTTHYVIEYDTAGHIWVAPPGKYDAAYSQARDATSNACYLDLL